MTTTPDGRDIWGCPRRQVSLQSHGWLKLYPYYKAGFLLRAGGIGNQPADYVEAMGLIEGEVARVLDATKPGTKPPGASAFRD